MEMDVMMIKSFNFVKMLPFWLWINMDTINLCMLHRKNFGIK